MKSNIEPHPYQAGTELPVLAKAQERTTKNQYRIMIASWPKRKRLRSRSLEQSEPIFTELFVSTVTEIAYNAYIAICTVATLKQDSHTITCLRLERNGIKVRELIV